MDPKEYKQGQRVEVKVYSEDKTLDLLLEGHSISRFGDGEFKMMRGSSIKSQASSVSLATRFNEIMRHDQSDYLVGIPRIVKGSPKESYWASFMPVQEEFLTAGRTYASALVTRPDSAPWIDNDEYWQKVMDLWRKKHVALIWGGSRKSLTPSMMFGCKKLDVIHAPSHHAWSHRKDIMAELSALRPAPEVVIICLGPTATGLVPEIVKLGMQALDLGHIGAWMRRLYRDTKNFQAAHGFFWPRGAEEYGKRYVNRASHMDVAIKLCPKRRSVIQAGGHVGVWPKYLAAQFMQVYTFEPEHMNFIALNRNCGEKHVYRMQAALGSENKPVNIVVHPQNIGGHHVMGRGLVPQIRIDDLGLQDVDMIVLDIEGSELDAILGAKLTIKRSRPVLHLEMRGHIEKYKRGTTKELERLLKDLGYSRHSEIGDDSVYVPAAPGGRLPK